MGNEIQVRDCTVAKDGIRLKLSFAPGWASRCNQGLQQAQAAFDAEVAKCMDPYVPFRTGVLKNSVITASHFGSGELVYNTPYASAQYYRAAAGTDLRDGVRGSYWGQRCIADHKAHLVQFARDQVKEGLD